MAKGILQYLLPEEQNEFETAVKSQALSCVLWDIDQYLRGKIKYAGDDVSEETVDALQATRNELWEYINDHGLTEVVGA